MQLELLVAKKFKKCGLLDWLSSSQLIDIGSNSVIGREVDRIWAMILVSTVLHRTKFKCLQYRERERKLQWWYSVLKNCVSLIKIAKINIILEYSQCGWITCDLLDTVLHTQVRAHTHTHTIPAPEIVGVFKFIHFATQKHRRKWKSGI